MSPFRSFCIPAILCAAIMLCCSCTPTNPAPQPVVNAETAMTAAMKNYSFGPRPAGSEALKKSLDAIRTEVESCFGTRIELDEFEDLTPRGKIKFRNMMVWISGKDQDSFYAVGAHIDTKIIQSVPGFAGANDGASGVGALTAMIHAVSREAKKGTLHRTVCFVFLDGEEAFLNYGANDGLHGSRHLAESWKRSGLASECKAFILLDMIGDRDLLIGLPENGSRELKESAIRNAEKLGCPELVFSMNNSVIDDHVPFLNAGIPAVDLIDFVYGPDNVYWHTEADSIDKISGVSMKKAADLALGIIWNCNTSSERK